MSNPEQEPTLPFTDSSPQTSQDSQTARPDLTQEGATVDHRPSKQLSGLHVRCPHCRNPIELLPDAELDTINCSTCGSNFSLTSEDDPTRDARGITQVGHFKLVERLGVGGFGAVWKAYDADLDRTVAVKIPRSGQLDKFHQDLFLREARSAAQLRHPNIVPVYEVGRDGDTLYIVSEFVRGVTLSDRLTAGPLSSRETVEVCAKIADALHHAHEQGVVHRDLKPANVMLDAEGEPHLMDFGLARRETNEITMTMEGQVLGTPAYMSPEQAQGEGHSADRRTDVYSMGVILFQLLTGELPFRGNSRMLVHQVIHDEPPSPRKLNASVPKDLETISLKCMEKSPDRRFATAKELGDEFGRFLGGEPIHSRPITKIERGWRWAKRKPGVAGLSAAIASLLLTIAIAGPLAAIRESALRKQAEANENRASQLASSEAQARKDAEAFGKLERQQREKVEKLAEENRRHLVGLNVLQGDALVERNELARALPWYVEALRLDQGDAAREAPHRLRLGMLWGNMPRFINFWRHKAAVIHLALSRDGLLVAATSDDSTVRVWNLETGKAETPPLFHKHPVFSSEFSADGKQLVTAGGVLAVNGEVRVWDIATAELAGEPIENPTTTYLYAAFTDAGDILTAESPPEGEGIARLWSGDTRKLLASHPFSPQTPSAESVSQVFNVPRGRLLYWEGETSKVIDLADGARTVCELPQTSRPTSVRFSDDGSRVFTAEWNQLKVWDVESGERLARYDGLPSGWNKPYYQYVISARFSLDNNRVTIADNEQVLQFVVDGGELSHFKSVPDVKRAQPMVSRDGRFVAFATPDGAVRTWDVQAEKFAAAALSHPGAVASSLFASGDRQLITACGDGGIRTWDLATASGLKWRQSVKNLGAAVTSEDGKEIITFGWPSISRWEADTHELISKFDDAGANMNMVHYLVDPPLIAAGRSDGTAQVYNYVTKKAVSPILRHEKHQFINVNISGDGKYLTTIDVDSKDDSQKFFGNANIWEIKSGRRIFGPFRFPGVISGLICLEFSPDSRFAAVGGGAFSLSGRKASLKLIDLATSQEVDANFEHSRGLGVWDVAFDEKSRRMVSITLDPFNKGNGELRIWDLDERRQIGAPKQFADDTERVVIDPKSRLVFVTVGTQVHVMDLETSQPAMPPLAHDGVVSQVTFDPAGNYAATIADDNVVRIWDVGTGRRIGPPLRHPDRVLNCQFMPVGGLLTAGGDGLVRCWNFISIERPFEEIERMARLVSAEELSDSRVTASPVTESLQEDWSTLQKRYPVDFVCTKDQAWLWHDVQATACWNHADWASAIPQFEQMEKVDNVNRFNFGLVLCETEQYRRGAEQFEKLFEQTAEPFSNWFVAAAIARLCADDEAGYRAVRQKMLETFGETQDAQAAANTAKVCLLTPNDFPPESLPFRLADVAMSQEAGHRLSTWIRLSKALAEYRAGDFEQSRVLLEKLIVPPHEPELTSIAKFLLAMARWGEEKRDEARDNLADAIEYYDSNPIRGYAGSFLNRTLVHMVRREAEALIESEPAVNQDSASNGFKMQQS